MDDDELIEPELDEELDEELDDEELDDEELDDPDLAEDPTVDPDADDVAVVEDDEEDDDAVPAARRKPKADDDEDEDDLDPDDVEADLDTILKDRIASGDDDEEDEEAEAVGEPGERVAAKSADEFTCPTCFLIVHPRQFGRAGNLTCPEGYDPCDAMPKVAALLKKAKKG